MCLVFFGIVFVCLFEDHSSLGTEIPLSWTLSHTTSKRQALPFACATGSCVWGFGGMGGARSCFVGFFFFHYIAVAYFHVILQFYQILAI